MAEPVIEEQPRSIPSWLRNPRFVGFSIFGAAVAAFGAAGVKSLALAKLILILFVWGFSVVEVAYSDWVKRTGRYRHSITLGACFLLGFGSVCLGLVIAEMKWRQERNVATTSSGQEISVIFKESPLFTAERKERLTKNVNDFYHYLTHLENGGFNLPTHLPPVGIQKGGGGGALALSQPGSNLDAVIDIPEESIDKPEVLTGLCSVYLFQAIIPRGKNDPLDFRTNVVWLFSNYYRHSFADRLDDPYETKPSKWESVLWEIRTRYGQGVADRVMLFTYQKYWPPQDKEIDFDQFFARRLLAGVAVVDNLGNPSYGIRRLLTDNGLLAPLPQLPKQPTFKEAPGNFVALVGGTQYSVSHLSTRQKPTRIIAFGDSPAITAYVENDRFYVDALLYYAPDKSPLHLVHNELKGRPPQWDRNFDDSAIEIVDERLTPRFQLIYMNARTVVLRGVFQYRDGAAVFDEHANYFIGSREKEVNITRIFRYPSRLHQGEELPDVGQ